MAFITLMAWLIIMTMIMLCCSCANRKEMITEVITVHDTIQTVRTDTIRDVKVVQVSGTVKEREVHTITINNVGDTIKEEHYYHDSEKIYVNDSTERYQASRDSLHQKLLAEKHKETIVVKNKKLKWIWIASLINVILFLLFLRRKTVSLPKK